MRSSIGMILLVITLLLSSSFLDIASADQPWRGTGNGYCDSKCPVRCSKAGRQNRCLKYCGICCLACNCVPSGTYGNKSECPCYANMKNSKGQPKCP
ncbi:hypothetical protein Leryth_013233 [Lithospermum erythrorhizon]|nr:hypothetical protein Leryth_013233 [Lithospermum erythrorhizon]